MNKDILVASLKKKNRSQAAITRTLSALDAFNAWLAIHHDKSVDDEVNFEEVKGFIAGSSKAKNLLMGLANMFAFQGRDELMKASVQLRDELLVKERKAIPLDEFLGVKPELVAGLDQLGIQDANQLLECCRQRKDREDLADRTGFSYQEILELVKMADLSRLFAVKAIRCRLYLDSGFNTLDKLSEQDPMELHLALVKYVDESGFPGIATTPKEAEGTVAAAREIKRMINYEFD